MPTAMDKEHYFLRDKWVLRKVAAGTFTIPGARTKRAFRFRASAHAYQAGVLNNSLWQVFARALGRVEFCCHATQDLRLKLCIGFGRGWVSTGRHATREARPSPCIAWAEQLAVMKASFCGDYGAQKQQGLGGLCPWSLGASPATRRSGSVVGLEFGRPRNSSPAIPNDVWQWLAPSIPTRDGQSLIITFHVGQSTENTPRMLMQTVRLTAHNR